MIVHLEKDKDPNTYEIKMNLINEKQPFKKFRLVDNLDEKVMHDFISWCRYVEFDGDMAQLYLFKNEAIIEAQKKQSDPEDIKSCFKGTSLKVISTENETRVWNKIIGLVNNSLVKYDTDY